MGHFCSFKHSMGHFLLFPLNVNMNSKSNVKIQSMLSWVLFFFYKQNVNFLILKEKLIDLSQLDYKWIDIEQPKV